jgi:predicted DNA-binding protein
MKRFEIKLPDERLKALKALADRDGVAAASLAKQAIGKLLDDRAATPGKERAA